MTLLVAGVTALALLSNLVPEPLVLQEKAAEIALKTLQTFAFVALVIERSAQAFLQLRDTRTGLHNYALLSEDARSATLAMIPAVVLSFAGMRVLAPLAVAVPAGWSGSLFVAADVVLTAGVLAGGSLALNRAIEALIKVSTVTLTRATRVLEEAPKGQPTAAVRVDD